ncbi:MAG: hypothetical protein Fur0022_18780 [Anaerolineales bacterium]
MEKPNIKKTNKPYIRQYEILADISKRLIATQELEQELNYICYQATKLLEADSSCILLVVEEDNNKVLKVRGHYGLGNLFIKETKIKIGTSITGRVVATKEPLVINNLAESNLLENPAASEEHFKAVISVPIRLDENVIGTVDVQSKTKTGVFTDDDTHTLKLLASQLAIAFHNSALYGRLRQLTSFAPEGIVGVNELGQVIEWNEEAEILLGYSKEEAKTLNVSDFYKDGFDEARHINRLMFQSKDKRVEGYDTLIRNKSGQLIPIRLTASLYYNHTGQPSGSFGYFRDRREFVASEEFAQLLTRYPAKTNLVDEIVAILARTLSAEICLLLRYNNQSDEMRLEGAWGSLSKIMMDESISLPVEELVHDILEKNQIVCFSKLAGDDSVRDAGYHFLHQLLQYVKIRDLLVVPLCYQEETIGLIVLLNKLQGDELASHGFSTADKDLVLRASRQVVGLLQRAQYRAGLEAFLKVGEKIMTLSNEQDVLQKIVDEVVATFGYRTAYYKQLEPDGSLSLRIVAGAHADYFKSLNFTTPPGKGIVSQVVQKKQLMSIPDLSKRDDFHFQSVRVQKKWGAMLAIPLMGDNDEVIGVFACYTARPHNFTSEEQNLVASFVRLAAVALRNARLFEETQKQLEEVRKLYAVSRSLITDQPLETLLRIIGERVIKALDANQIILIAFDLETQQIFHFVPFGYEAEKIQPIPFDILMEGLTGWVIRKRQTVISPKNIPDLRESYVTQEMRKQSNTGSVIVVPLIYHGKIIGTITATNRMDQRDFTEYDRVLLEVMAGQAAMAIENARVVEIERQWRSELVSLNKKNVGLSSHLNRQQLFQRTVETTIELFKADGVHIFLYDGEELELGIAYWDGKFHPTPYQGKIPSKNGLTYQVARTGVREEIPDIRKDPRYHTWQDGTLIALPLIVGMKVRGVMNIGFNQPRRIGPNELRSLELMATQTATAIDNANRYENLARLEKAGEALAKAIDLRDVMRAMMETIPELVHADGGFVWLYNSKLKQFDPEGRDFFGIGKGVIVWAPGEPRPGTLIHQILEEREVVIENVEEMSKAGANLKLEQQEKLLQEGIRAFIGLGLQAGKDNMGILFVNFRQTFRKEEHLDEIATLRIFADRAAEAIHRSRLFRYEQQKQQLLTTITQVVSSVKDLEKTWKIILDAAMEITGAEYGNISLVKRGTGQFEYVVTHGIPDKGLPTTQGIQGYVAEHKKWVNISNVQTDIEYKDIYFQGLLDTRSELCGPILHGTQKLVGIINLESPREGAFDQEAEELLKTLARYADIAVQNAKRFEQLNKFNKVEQEVLTSFEVDTALHTILEGAISITDAHFGTLRLITDKGLELRAARPKNYYVKLKSILPVMPIDKRGIVAKAFRENDSKLVPNVNEDPDYLNLSQKTGSELAVPIQRDGIAIGVLNVEHRDIEGLDKEDQELLVALANLASVAINNIEQQKKLSRRDLLIRLGVFGATWVHSIGNRALEIKDVLSSLQQNVSIKETYGELVHLAEMEANNIFKDAKALQAMLEDRISSSESPLVVIYDLLDTWISQWQTKARECKFISSLSQLEDVQIYLEDSFLKQALDILMENALHSISNSAKRQIEFSASISASILEICIKDTGMGIRPELLEKLGKEPIPKELGDRGGGLGVWIATTIIESLGGEIKYVSNLGQGTIALVILPVKIRI